MTPGFSPEGHVEALPWFDHPEGLPAMLAEYGRVAARLRDADPDQAHVLHRRLADLDAAIDRMILQLGAR